MFRINKKLRYTLPVILTSALLAMAGSAQSAPSTLPDDVASFVERRDICDSLRGEEAYDAERAKDLEIQLNKYCKGTDKQLEALKKKYKAQRRVLNKLNEYDPGIEPPAN